jgi:hypothetical protein
VFQAIKGRFNQRKVISALRLSYQGSSEGSVRFTANLEGTPRKGLCPKSPQTARNADSPFIAYAVSLGYIIAVYHPRMQTGGPMHEKHALEKTESRSNSRRFLSSLPSLVVFVAMVYFSVVFFRDGLSLSRIPLWMRLPFFLYCGLTIFVGLIAVRTLFPSKRRENGLETTSVDVLPDAKGISSIGKTSSATFIVTAAQVAYSVLMFGCSLVISTLLFRSPSSFGTTGLAVFGVIAFILLIASLKWPMRAIRKKLKSGGPESAPETRKPRWKRIIVASLSFCFALAQTLAIGLYRDRTFALVFTALCWMWASFHIWDLFRSRRAAPVPHSG